MKSYTTHKQFLPFAVLFSILVITSLACTAGNISIGKDSATIDLTITENQLNDLFNNISTNDTGSDRLLDKVTSVEMHDGYIRVFGEATNADGNKVTGSYDVSFGTENDALKVEIIAVDIEGVDMNDQRIVDANQELGTELAKSIKESNGDVLFKEAVVTEDALKLKVQVKIK